jgi:ribosomal protein S17E
MRGTRKIDWLNHFLEFVVVIVGILIAFQLNTCSQNKKEQQLVDRHIANIIEETEFNKNNFIYASKKVGEAIKTLDTLLTYIEEAKDLDSINALSIEMLNLPITYIKRNSYNSLVESGDIRLVSNFELKEDVIQLYEFYSWAEGIDKVTAQTYNDYFLQYLIENLDLVTTKTQERSVYESKKFRNSLAVYSYHLRSRLAKYEELQEMNNEFLATYKKD